MNQNKIIRFIFLLSFLNISLLKCSQTIQDTINLQQNERYILKLEDYYDFTASQIDFPQNQLEEYIQVPYQEIGSQNEGSKLSSITSYQDGLNSKYLIGFNTVRNQVSNNLDIQIIYFHLEISQGILTRTQLASQTLFSSTQANFQIKASFYSSTDGFISYKSDLIQGTSHFSYIENQGMITVSLRNINYIGKHVAMKGKGNNIYIIYVDDAAVNLLKYQTGGDTLLIIDTQNIDAKISDTIVVDTINVFLGYDFIKNILHCFYIDYKNDKLIINQLTLPQFDNQYFVHSLQRFKDNLILTLIDQNNNGNIYINLIYNKLDVQNNITLDNIIETKLYFNSIPIFIDQNILVFYQSNSFQIFNVKTQQVIFKQNLDQNYSFDPYQYIGNQFLIEITKQDDQGIVKYLSQAARIQNPSQLIIGINQLLEYTIHQSDQPCNLKIQIQINVTDLLITKFTKDLINLQQMVTSNQSYQVYQIPVGNFISGSNLNPEITVNSFIQNMKLNKLNQIKQLEVKVFFDIQNTYQTDGLISSLIICSYENYYIISAATVKLNKDHGEIIQNYSTFDSVPTIGLIDNYGSFIFQSNVETHTFTINVPFIVSNKQGTKYLYYNTFTTNCSTTNFAFASDPYSNILFILCHSSIIQISYQYNNAKKGELFVVSQNNLIFDATQYQKLICIKGILYIQNDQTIAAYDYQVNSFLGNPMQIPQLQHDQQIILFSQTFIISYQNQQKLNILLYSYDQFQNQGKNAVFVRYLLLDQPFQENLSLIPKRNNIEYLYVSTKVQNQYQLFRINNAYSQNQFYTSVSIESDSSNFPVISQNGFCLISTYNTRCWQILEQPTLTYKLKINYQDYIRLLTFQSLITLKIGDQQQTYNLNIVRNTSTQYGKVNQFAKSIQQLQTDLQDSYSADRTTFYFDDQNVFDACILGWESLNPNALIINRLNNVDSKITSYVFTILYNQKAVLESNQIKIGNNWLTIQGDFSQNCQTILDDSASKVQVNPSSFNQNIYLICQDRLYKFLIEFTSDKTGAISHAALLDQNSQSFDTSNQQIHFRRIVSIDSELWLFDTTKFNKYLIEKKKGSEKLSVSSQFISLTSILSFNVVSSLNLRLSFYRSGLINVKNIQDSKDIQYSYYYLQDLLNSNNFVIGENDEIASIYQYSDTKFRIQYTLSLFIYDITFSLDRNQQLILDSASLYYFKDAFDVLQTGITGDQYTLLFGEQKGNIIAALYNNQSIIQQQYLIQSGQKINQKSVTNDSVSITYAEQISQNQFVIYFSNGSSTSINISDKVGIQILDKQSYQKQVTIQPYLLPEEYQFQISLRIPSPPPSPSPQPSYQTIILFSMNILFLLSLLV